MERIKFYFDEHMPRSVAREVEKCGYEVIMAIDVEMVGKDDDAEHLPFAKENNAIIFTRDYPFAGRTAKHTDHAGLICWTGRDDDYGGMVRKLNEFAEKYTPEDVAGQVFWIK